MARLSARERVLAVLDAQIPPGADFVAADVADAAIEKLERDNPKLLTAFAGELLRETVIDFYTAVHRERRRAAHEAVEQPWVTAARERDFGRMEEERQRRSVFETYLTVDAANTRRTIGQMTGADHQFVADAHRLNAERRGLLAAFHTAIAKRVRTRTTADVMTEQEYLRLYRSIVKPTTPEEGAA